MPNSSQGTEELSCLNIHLKKPIYTSDKFLPFIILGLAGFSSSDFKELNYKGQHKLLLRSWSYLPTQTEFKLSKVLLSQMLTFILLAIFQSFWQQLFFVQL